MAQPGFLAERQRSPRLDDLGDVISEENIMKTIFATVCLFAVALASPVQAKGCIKGAIVGGVAGHMAGRVLHGNPGKPGLHTVRLKMPANSKMPVHSHPDERVRVIISGTY